MKPLNYNWVNNKELPFTNDHTKKAIILDEALFMSKIAIVTDSSSNIPSELLKEHSIFIIPLHIIWGEEILRSGVDIQPQDFYARLKRDKKILTTSQPSPAVFKEQFIRLLDEGYEVICILISSKLSGTIASAVQAKQDLLDSPIEIVDSKSITAALGFQVLCVAQAAKNVLLCRSVKA